MRQDYKTSMYYESNDEIAVIEEVYDVDFFLNEREKLANAMGYDTDLKPGRKLIISQNKEVIGTYFSGKEMN